MRVLSLFSAHHGSSFLPQTAVLVGIRSAPTSLRSPYDSTLPKITLSFYPLRGIDARYYCENMWRAQEEKEDELDVNSRRAHRLMMC